jgi:hypothetical protein
MPYNQPIDFYVKPCHKKGTQLQDCFTFDGFLTHATFAFLCYNNPEKLQLNKLLLPLNNEDLKTTNKKRGHRKSRKEVKK